MKLSDIHMRDPFILNDNGKYYLYGTRGSESIGKYTCMEAYESTDLENWFGPHTIFVPPEDFWGTLDAWAPEVHKYKGKYYCFVSFRGEEKTRATHILVSESPLGPFFPNSADPVTPADWACLDGTLYISKKGVPYIVFCHEWEQVRVGEICAQELSESLEEPVGEPFVLFRADEPDWADGLDMPIGRAYVTDGPFMHRMADGRLVMLWSSFAGGEYVEAVAYSDNGEIDGNWKHIKKLLFDRDGGHGMLFVTDTGKTMFVMHYPNVAKKERPKIQIFEENFC